MTVRIAILGSCTTRDSVVFWPERWELVGYGARHPLASLRYPSSFTREDAARSQGMSPWRERQYVNDIKSMTLPTLLHADPDILFLDVTDDRLGVVDRPDGGRASAMKGSPGRPGSDDDIRAALGEIVGAVPKVVLNAAEWAGKRWFFNQYLERVAAIASEEGAEVVWTRDTTEERGHQWGPGPFHLIEEDYVRMARNLEGTV